MPEIVSSFCVQPAKVAVMFYWKLSRHPLYLTGIWYRSAALHRIEFAHSLYLKGIWYRSAALHRIEFATCRIVPVPFCPYLIFTQRPRSYIFKTLLWNSLPEWLPDDQQGLKLVLNFVLYSLANELWRWFYLLWNLWIKGMEFEFF